MGELVVCVPCAILMYAHMKRLRERHGQAWGRELCCAVTKVVEVEDDEWSNHIDGYVCPA